MPGEIKGGTCKVSGEIRIQVRTFVSLKLFLVPLFITCFVVDSHV